jgi:hypothetical protein
LKASVFGYNSTNSTYEALQINNNGELKVNTGTAPIQIGTVSNIGTLNKVATVGTLNKVAIVGTINKVALLGTLSRVAMIGTLGTLNKVATVGTLGTLNKVATVGTLNKVAIVGTINNVALLGTLNRVATVGTLGTLNKVATVGTLNNVAIVGTLNKVALLGTLTNVVGTVKLNLVDRIFDSITQTIAVAASTVTYTNLINISKYEDTSWYLRNITTTNRIVSIQLTATPSSNLTTYPRVLISETTTINATPHVVTNDYYLKYISAQISNTATIPQSVVVVFNGRY